MRRVDENRAENFIKKHRDHRKWVAFALCVALLTGSVTLYMLNKPATAMTEEGARSVGLVLETAGTEYEQGLLRQMEEENSDEDQAAEEETVSADTEKTEEEAASEAEEETTEDTEEESEESEDTEEESEESEETLEETEELTEEEVSEDDSKSEKVIETVNVSDVVLTARFIDRNGDEIKDSQELELSEETEFKKDESTAVEGYFFNGVLYDDELIVKAAPVFGESKVAKAEEPEKSEESENSEESADEEAQETEETTVVYVKGYVLTTADGENIEISEDAELEFAYIKASENTEFTYSDDKITVTAVTNEKYVLPEGVELRATEITAQSSDYSYDAYLQAMNDNAQAIAEETGEEKAVTYSENNTLIYDIAFMMDEVEYQPEEGSVSIFISLNDRQLSGENGITEEDNVTVLHLPISEEIMEGLDATSNATDISASDVSVEVLEQSSVELGSDADRISFVTDSFSAHAITWTHNNYSWEGSTEYSTGDILGRLGKSQYFGAVADVYVGTNSDSENSIAANELIINSPHVIGNSLLVYEKIKGCTVTLTKTIDANSNNKDREFGFAVFTDSEGRNRIGQVHKIKVPKKHFAVTETIEFYFDGDTNTLRIQSEPFKLNTTIATSKLMNLFIFEVDSNGNAIQNGSSISFKSPSVTYDVSYTADEIKGGNSIINGLTESYARHIYQGIGGADLDRELEALYNGTLPYASEKTIYGALRDIPGNKIYYIEPPFLQGYDYISSTYVGGDGKNHDSSKTLAGHYGDFPVNVNGLLNEAASLSSDLAAAKTSASGKTEVYNMKATTGNFLEDAQKAGLVEDQNDVQKTDEGKGLLRVADGHIAIVNLDLTNYKDSKDGYKVVKFAANGTGSGSWSDLAEKIIFNPVQYNSSTGEFEPYTGRVTFSEASGTVIAPRATVTFEGSFSGTAIADKLWQKCEMHKWELRLDKKLKAKIDVVNKDTSLRTVDIELTKIWDTTKTLSKIAENSVEFTLYKKRQNSSEYEPVTGVTPTLTKNLLSNTWTYKWTGLDEPDGFEYYVAETKVPNDFTSSNPVDKKLLVVFDDGESTGTVTGTARITNKDIPHGKIKKEWIGAEAPYPNLYVYVCARTYGGDKDNRDKPQYSSIVELTPDKNWEADVPFFADYDGEENASNALIYRVVEINAFKNGKNLDAGLFSRQELERMILNGETIDIFVDGVKVGEKSKEDVLMYDNSKVSGFMVTYESTIKKDATYQKASSWQRVIYTPGQSGATVTIKNNWDYTNLVVEKQWGEDKDPYAYKYGFDVYIQLLRRVKADEDGQVGKFEEVEGERKKLEWTNSATPDQVVFENLPLTNDKGKEYEYSVKEYYRSEDGDVELVQEGSSVNGFKLKSIEPMVVEDGLGIKLTNIPVLVIEKKFSDNGKILTEQEAAGRNPIYVHLYKYKGETLVSTDKLVLSSGNHWRQEVEISRGFTNANNHDRQYVYCIVECNEDGSRDYDDSELIWYYSYVGEGENAIVNSGITGRDIVIRGNEAASSVLKLEVVNRLGGNVLPESGGSGTAQYAALGALLIAIALAGILLFRKRETL